MDQKTYNKWFTGPKVINKIKQASSCPSEHSEQVAFVKWLRKNNYKFTSIPNASKISYNAANKNAAEGLCAGLPDMLIIVKNSLIWIEMKKIDRKPKRGGSGGVSDVQKEWIDALNQCSNCQAFVCYGAEEAKTVIIDIDKASAIV